MANAAHLGSLHGRTEPLRGAAGPVPILNSLPHRVYSGAAPFGIVVGTMATDQHAHPAQDRRRRRGLAPALGTALPQGRQSRVATRSPRPVEYSPSTQQWLDFLAGLLAQAAWAEQAAADTSDLTSRP